MATRASHCVQAAAAEEAVLWDLTTRVIDAVYDIQAVLDMVSLLSPYFIDSRTTFWPIAMWRKAGLPGS